MGTEPMILDKEAIILPIVSPIVRGASSAASSKILCILEGISGSGE